MTDTNNIEQRARELLAAEYDRTVEGMHYYAYGVVTLNVTLSAIRRALSARASAGEGGELDAHDFAYRHLSVPGCDGERAWTQWQQFGKDMQIRRLTAAPQPAQAGASGGGEIPVCPRCSKALPPRRGAGRTLFSTPCTDCMEWKSPHRDTPASPATGEDFEAWFAKQDSRTEWRELVRLAYYATPQPAQAGASGGGYCEAHGKAATESLVKYACGCSVHESGDGRNTIATPASPATGEGKEKLVPDWSRAYQRDGQTFVPMQPAAAPQPDLTRAVGVVSAALLAKLPSLETLEAVDDDLRRGARPCPLNNLTITDVRLLRRVLSIYPQS